MEIFVMHDGQQVGPLSPGAVQDRIESGVFLTDDYGWTVGLDQWKPLLEVLPQWARPVAKPSPPLRAPVNTANRKTCPFCKEKIQAAAIKCRFCGEWLETKRNAQPAVLDTTEPPQGLASANSKKAGAMNPAVRKWYQEIGAKGGRSSKRVLTSEQAKAMRAKRGQNEPKPPTQARGSE